MLDPGFDPQKNRSGRFADCGAARENGSMLRPGQQVRVNLAGMQVGSVTFHAAVTDAVGTIVQQVSENPPRYLVKLLFSFRGVDEVEVPETRIVAK
jgi:hypothetical protein